MGEKALPRMEEILRIPDLKVHGTVRAPCPPLRKACWQEGGMGDA